MSSLIVFVEGKHDIIFFQKFMKSKKKAVKIIDADANITKEIRRFISGALPGVLLINCGGASKIYSLLPIIMRQMIWYAEHILMVIGDSDMISPRRLAHRLETYIRTPSKAHVLKFVISHRGNDIRLIENSKGYEVKTQVHLVPINLETEILRMVRSKYKRVKLPISVNEDTKLRVAARKLGYSGIQKLIRESVNWLMNTPWLKSIGKKLS